MNVVVEAAEEVTEVVEVEVIVEDEAARDATKTLMMTSLRRLDRGSRITAEEVAVVVEAAEEATEVVEEEVNVVVIVENAAELDLKLPNQGQLVMPLHQLQLPQSKSEHFEMSDLKAINLFKQSQLSQFSL